MSMSCAPGSVVHALLEAKGERRPRPTVELPLPGSGVLGGCALYIDGKPATVVLLEGARRPLRARGRRPRSTAAG
jgi:hypothetical protein